MYRYIIVWKTVLAIGKRFAKRLDQEVEKPYLYRAADVLQFSINVHKR